MPVSMVKCISTPPFDPPTRFTSAPSNGRDGLGVERWTLLPAAASLRSRDGQTVQPLSAFFLCVA